MEQFNQFTTPKFGLGATFDIKKAMPVQDSVPMEQQSQQTKQRQFMPTPFQPIPPLPTTQFTQQEATQASRQSDKRTGLKDFQSQSVEKAKQNMRKFALYESDIDEIYKNMLQEYGLEDGMVPKEVLVDFAIQAGEQTGEPIVNVPDKNRFQRAGFQFVDTIQDIGTAGTDRWNRARKIMGEADTDVEAVWQGLGQAAGFVSDVIGEGVVGGVELADTLIANGVVLEEAEEQLKNFAQTEIGKAGLDALGEGMESFQERSLENPRASANLGALLNIGEVGLEFVGGGAIKKAGQQAGETALVQAGRQAINKGVSSLADTDIGRLAQQGLDVVGQQTQRARRGIADLTDKGRQKFINQITGVDEVNRKILVDRANIDLVRQAEKGDLTRESILNEYLGQIKKIEADLGDTGSLYQSIRNIGEKFDISEVKSAVDDALSKYDIKVGKGGKLGFDDSPIGSASSQKTIQNAYNIVSKRKQAEPRVILNLRRKLDDMIGYESGVSDAGKRAVREIRRQLDAVAKNKIPGLKKADERFAPLVKEVKEARSRVFKRDGSLKEGAESYLANIAKPTNRLRQEAIEKIAPGISKKAQVIEALNDLQRATDNKPGLYTRGAVGAFALTSLNPALMIGAFLSNPKTIISLLQKREDISPVIENMLNRAKNGIFTRKDANKIIDVMEEVPEMADDALEMLALPAPKDLGPIAVKQADELVEQSTLNPTSLIEELTTYDTRKKRVRDAIEKIKNREFDARDAEEVKEMVEKTAQFSLPAPKQANEVVDNNIPKDTIDQKTMQGDEVMQETADTLPTNQQQ